DAASTAAELCRCAPSPDRCRRTCLADRAVGDAFMPWMRLCFPASRRRPLRFPSWRTRTALGPRRQVRTFQFAISPTRPKLPRVPSAQQTCIVTGTGGYLGGRVKAALQQRGWRVVVLTRQPGPDTSAIRFQLGEEVSAADLKGAGALVHCAY